MAQGIVESSNQDSEQEQQGQPAQGSRGLLVQRLLDAPNLPAFLNDLLSTQATTVAGTEAAGFIIDRTEEGFSLKLLSHLRPDNCGPEMRAAAIKAFTDLIRPCIEQQNDTVFEIGPTTDIVEPQYCLITMLRSEGQAVAVSAVITRCINVDRAKQRLQSMQLVAGYFELFTLRHNIDQSRLIAQSHQHVLQLATAVATAEGFASAAMNLCNELATRASATRVSLGWVKGRNIRVRALSHTEEFDKKQELIVQLERAMEECADQEEIVHYNPAGQSTENVTRESAALSRSQGGHLVLSLPLRHRAEVVGVVTLEFLPQTQLSPNVGQGLAVAVELLAPQLFDRYQNDRWLITKAALGARDVLAKATGPRYMMAKTIIVLVLAAVAFITFYKPMYHASAPFEFGALDAKVVSAPFDGEINDIGRKPDGEPLRPGDTVTQGQTLAVLNTYELGKKKLDALKRAEAAQKEEEKYRSQPNKIADANIAHMQYLAAMEDVQFYSYQIDHSTITAPISGTIIKGDLSQRSGTSIHLGDELFTLSGSDALRVQMSVAERDIQDVKIGAHGMLATDSLPSDRYPFTVTRIIPSPEAKEGSNSFIVYGQLEKSHTAASWRPGMAGEARVDVAPKRLAWIWTHRLIDFLRLKLWM